METFVDKMYPNNVNLKTGETVYGKPDELSVCDALNEILTSKSERFTTDEFVKIIRQRLVDKKIHPKIFMRFSRWIYKQCSDKSCHKMTQYFPPLPNYKDIAGIQKIFLDVGLNADAPAVICVQIITEPLPMRLDCDTHNFVSIHERPISLSKER